MIRPIVGKDYVRLGPSGAIHIYSLSDLAEDMSLDITYKRLFRISGDDTPVYAFKADLSYWIAGSEHVPSRQAMNEAVTKKRSS